ncbi:sulfite exporter TauE/SafE [Lachnoanaerobaculum saburreum F0468]|jgi:membrane protein|uniref:Probable membrane transporter protein n=1 Tax=Lachnoanaerobaculum saburreum F0468 TaxID=1095750 RepID=I0R3L9_9FIRM|nr:sulfite exporter TauE/SafE family protein [Lachnoanaerobaculum saburreum]EIC94277.1 sulfite exporter TauE/SafE [Lachnoanaerobaculum saburreum F0468]RKW44820.1 MAG: anion permease [Lachnospiraceae bacterium]
MSVQTILLAVLAILTVIYLIVFVLDLIKHKNDSEKGTNFIVMSVIGFVINFFDVFGIGSFATGTALMKAFKQTDDRLIPGTLNVCFCIPVAIESFLFINGVEVEPVTLASMIVAAVVGAYLGAGVVAKLPTKVIRLLMGTALIVIGIVIVIQMMGLIPSSGVATGLSGIKLVIGIAANFILGALMTAGVGMYAPCLALVCLLGINPMIAFPIMMGSSAYLMPVASLKFIKEGAYNRKASLAIAIFGIFGVFIGYRFIKMLNLNALKFIIIIVMAYSAVSLFYSAYKDSKK